MRTIVSMIDELSATILWPGTSCHRHGQHKGEICAALDRLPAGIQPVGAHPMTGKEQAGFTAAEPGLYVGAPWVLSPLPRTSPAALALVTELAQVVGARPFVLEAQRHDRLVAAISHLPFLLATALVHTVADTGEDDPMVWELAAGGFRDTSRVAASDTRMFMDILATNREAVLAQIDCFADHLQELRALLATANEAELAAKLTRSQKLRAEWRKK
ncbi:MAG: prephenate dehydrogenase/arogenate dehydrogenase family protein [Caldilineaceae bacterium]